MQKLDAKFWKTFANRNWEKSPLVVKNVNSALLQMDEVQVFKLLVLFADQCRKKKDSEGFKFFVDGEALYHEEVLDLLPLKSDKSLLGYHKRMNEVFEDYCLVCDELLQVNAEKQSLLTEFTQGLYKQVGFPNRFAEMGLYLGNYRKTPFGVHVDGCGVFSFPVAGTKNFRIWKPQYVEKNPSLNRAFDYKKHLKASQLLTAQHGDMTYWPSSAWHIAEGDGSFSATWSLGIWIDRPFNVQAGHVVQELVEHAIGDSGLAGMTPFDELHKSDGELSTLPALYNESIKSLAKLTEEKLELKFQSLWMKHISKQGFKTSGKAIRSGKLNSKFEINSVSTPIIWKTSGKTLYCAYAGVLVEAPISNALVDAIKTLNAGKVFVLKALGSKPKASDLKFLESLNRLGAFKAVSSRS